MAGERQVIKVIDPVPMMDTGALEHMQRIASIMAKSSLIPDALRIAKVVDEDGNAVRQNGKALMDVLPYENVLANCFLVVNQAVRWGLDPFAVSQCVSVVRGKLCYEGKLVAAVLEGKLGVKLSYTYDAKPGDQRGVIVSGQIPGEGVIRTITGTVGSWKTTGSNSPWGRVDNHERMLAYRGAREWVRRHAPGMLLGVYTDDEMDDLQAAGRASQLRGIEPVRDSLAPTKPSPKAKAIAAPVAPEGEQEQTTEIVVSPDASPKPPLGDATMQEDAGGPARPLASSQDQPEPAASEALQEPASAPASQPDDDAGQDDDRPPPEPTDDASYQAHVFWWGTREADYAAAKLRWTTERTMRNKLQISSEVVDRCKDFLSKTWEG